MYNPESLQFDAKVIVSNERFTELIRKEERLSTIERMIKKIKYISANDIKVLLGIEVTECGETNG